MRSESRTGTPRQRLYAASAALLGVGVLVRIWAFALRGPLWTDEAGLALNIVGRDFDAVARPFLNQQYAPYLYVISDKLATLALGASEYALRLPSLLAGLALLPTVARLTSRLAGVPAALFALALLVPNGLIVHYSTELKPYEQDALVAAFLAVLALSPLQHGLEPATKSRSLLTLGVCGVLAPWLSLPSIFVLAAIGMTLLLAAWRRGESRSSYWALLALGTAWLISFAAHYALFLRASPDAAAELQQYWAAMDAFAPFPPRSLVDLRWYLAKFFYLFNLFIAQDAAGLRYLAAALWLFGMRWLWQRDRALCALMLLPIALLMAAVATRSYILSDRTVLFLLPFILVPTALGLAALAQLRGLPSRVTAIALTAAACLMPWLDLTRALNVSQAPADMRTVVAHLKQNFRAGDRVYVETQVDWIYAFYARRAAFAAPYLKAESRLDSYDPRQAVHVLDTIKDTRRVWTLVPALGGDTPPDAGAIASIREAERIVTEHMRQLGREVEIIDGGNVRLYLYDLTAAAANDAH